MSFQNTVLKVSVVIFIILMVLIALMMLKAKQNQVWPPEQSSCPDFWEYDEGTQKCLNSKQLGRCDGSDMQNDAKCVYPTGTANWDSNVLFNLDKGEEVSVIGGPACAHSGTWWEVLTESGYSGWMRELLPDKKLIEPVEN